MKEIRKMNNGILNKEYETFIDYIDVSNKTIESYKNGIISMLEYFELHSIVNPNRNDIKSYRDWLLSSHSSNTVNSYMTGIREFFKYLEMVGVYQNVAKDIKGAKVSTTPKKQILTKQQVVNIYHSLSDLREKALFSLLVTTGLRGVEVANARIEDIKKYNDEIVLWIQCKGHSSRDEFVKIPENVFQDIRNYVGNRTSGYIFIGDSNRNKGQQLTTKTIRLIIKTILRRFGLDEDTLSLHSLRRTFASVAYENGADIYSIQQVLHHKSINTTTIYLRSSDRNKNNTEYSVSDCLFNKEVN